MRRAPTLVLLAALAAGCGGHPTGGSLEVVPLSPYGAFDVAAGSGFNGRIAAASFSNAPSSLAAGTLTLGESYDLTGYSDDGAPLPARRVEMTLVGYAGKPGTGYPLGDGRSAFRLYERAPDGAERAWVATGGRIVDGGIDAHRRLLRLERVAVAPVPETGAAGTATLDGGFHVEFAAGSDPSSVEPTGGRRAS